MDKTDGTIIAAIGIIAAIASLAILFISRAAEPTKEIGSDLPPELFDLPNSMLTDEQLIDKTRNFIEIKTLLRQYPDVDVEVLRLYELKPDARNIIVTYSVQKYVTSANGTSIFRQMIVTVDFDKDTKVTFDISVRCEGFGFDPSRLSEMALVNIQNDICFK